MRHSATGQLVHGGERGHLASYVAQNTARPNGNASDSRTTGMPLYALYSLRSLDGVEGCLAGSGRLASTSNANQDSDTNQCLRSWLSTFASTI